MIREGGHPTAIEQDPEESKEMSTQDVKDVELLLANAEQSSVKKDILESARNTLLSKLPNELQDRWKDADIPKLNEIVNAREQERFKSITGYHTSDVDLNVGNYVEPGEGSELHYATKLDKLYPKKAKYLYIIDGSEQDNINDDEYGWRTSYSKKKIIEKIPLTEENIKNLGIHFAELQYS